jgi:CheY-like chemotaxis protein/HPt (histidine-containing phosphotransfer) domain-containing protein
VRDTGIGISADKVELLFKKFSQVDSSTTRAYGGTGLGLAISKQLTEMMGGNIGVQSEPGKGSEFWFTVILAKQAQGAGEKPKLSPTDLHNVKILIVDDNDTNREILTGQLSSWGMRPANAMNGKEALDLLHKAVDEDDRFRIAIIDRMMPVMDGKALGVAIRQDSRLANTCMVMLTSLGIRGELQDLEEAGFDVYLTKPVRRQELYNALGAALTRAGQSAGMKMKAEAMVTRHSLGKAETVAALDGADRAPVQSRGSTARILLAEDNLTNQQVALGMLKNIGLNADVVSNGAEAVAILEIHPYDLVLMDVQMPELDGMEATRKIRDSQSINRAIPIIAMTAHAMQGDRAKCLESGMNDYLAKPIMPQALAEALGKWLPATRIEEPMNSRTESLKISNQKEPELPVWDQQGLQKRLLEDEDLVKIVILGFLDDIPRQIKALRQSLENHAGSEFQLQVHAIKGAAANVGGERLREIAQVVESEAKAGNLAAAGALLAKLEEQFLILKEEMMRKSES